ncbi:MAG: hypothetical protein WEE89_04555 [Gemmatimonadota bacterium]
MSFGADLKRRHVVQFLEALWIPALCGACLALSAVLLGPFSVLFALLLNAFVRSQVAGFAQVKSVQLPGSYYRLRRLERGGAIYRYLGIRFFKRLMTSKLYRRINPDFRFRQWSDSPRDLLDRMQSAEGAHLTAFLLMLTCSCVGLAMGSVRAAFWLFVFNLIGNGYPVMLQRYNRGRLERITARTRIPCLAPSSGSRRHRTTANFTS